jgi:hypothetical protein
MRTCSKCGQTNDDSLFASPNVCKACRLEQIKNYDDTHREQRRVIANKYYESRRDLKSEYGERYYATYHDTQGELLSRARQYFRQNGIDHKTVPQELLEAKAMHIKLLRAIRQKKEELV